MLLIDEFLKRFNESFQKNILGIAPECISLLESYDWPGNVRELKNVGILPCSYRWASTLYDRFVSNGLNS